MTVLLQVFESTRKYPNRPSFDLISGFIRRQPFIRGKDPDLALSEVPACSMPQAESPQIEACSV